MRILTLFLLGTLISFHASAARDLRNVTIEVKHVRDNIHMLTGAGGFAGGNIAVSAGTDGALMVDAQFSGMSGKIRAALETISPGTPRFLLNTHWHRDHTDGNRKFAPASVVIAHENVRRRVSSRQEVFGEAAAPLPALAWPVITFDRKLQLHFNGETIHFQHQPHSHTDGDGTVWFSQSRVLHAGDLFFNGTFPFVDLGSGGNALGLRNNLLGLIDGLPDDVLIIPGHGPLATLDDLREYHDMIEQTIDWVSDEKKKGRKLLELQTQGLPEEWDAWNGGFIKGAQWIGFIWHSLEKQVPQAE